MKKKFKSITVGGTHPLVTALAAELELLGYTVEDRHFVKPYTALTTYENGVIALKSGTDGRGLGMSATWYKLPEQYEEALKAASEIVEEIPEYVEAVMNLTGIEKGKIYPMKASTIIDGKFNDYTYNPSEEDKYFKLSTKEAFDAQNNSKSIIDTLVEGQVYWSNNSVYKEGHIWKFGSIKNSGFIYVDAILHPDLKEFEINSGLNDAHWENLRLATSEERQWLDSCIKAGKYLTKEKALKPVFKVGDWVYDTISCTVQQIKATDHNGADLHIQGWTFYKQLRKATPEEIAEVTKPKLPAQITLTLGTSNIKVTVYKDGKVKAGGHDGTIDEVKLLIRRMKPTGCVAGWEISFPSIKIGCSTFTLDELKQIVTAHDKLNELEW